MDSTRRNSGRRGHNRISSADGGIRRMGPVGGRTPPKSAPRTFSGRLQGNDVRGSAGFAGEHHSTSSVTSSPSAPLTPTTQPSAYSSKHDSKHRRPPRSSIRQTGGSGAGGGGGGATNNNIIRSVPSAAEMSNATAHSVATSATTQTNTLGGGGGSGYESGSSSLMAAASASSHNYRSGTNHHGGLPSAPPPALAREAVDPATQSYYDDILANFNLLSVVTNPRQRPTPTMAVVSNDFERATQSVWDAIWNSELLGGEGELEEYDPSYTNELSSNPLWAELERYYGQAIGSGSAGGGGFGGITGHGSPSHGMGKGSVHSAGSMDGVDGVGAMAVDLSEFERFLRRTGGLANKFVSRGEQLEMERKRAAEARVRVGGAEASAGLGDGEDVENGHSSGSVVSPEEGNDDEVDGQDNERDADAGDAGTTSESVLFEASAQQETFSVEERDHRVKPADPDKQSIGPRDGSTSTSKADTTHRDDGRKTQRQNKVRGKRKAAVAPKKKKRNSQQQRRKKGHHLHEQHGLVAQLLLQQPQQPQQRYLQLEQCEAVVPETFFSPHFDLTDVVTFESVINYLDDTVTARLGGVYEMDDEEGEVTAVANAAIVSPENRNGMASTVSVGEGLVETALKSQRALPSSSYSRKLTHEESHMRKAREHREQLSVLTEHLDTVEMALLEQVRSKSQMYFTETNRFAELKALVHNSISEVDELRGAFSRMRQHAVREVEDIPKQADARRSLDDMQRVLDGVSEVVSAKASIGGLLAAGDFGGAIESMMYARSLLAGGGGEDCVASNGFCSAAAAGGGEKCLSFRLGKLRCLSNVDAQLGEYEKLVVDNLSNTIVDIFLSWDVSSSSSSSSSSSATNPSSSLSSSSMLINSSPSSKMLLSATSPSSGSSHRAHVKDLVRNLTLCGKLSHANNLYTSRLCEMIKLTVRTTVMECVADAENLPTGASVSVGAGKGKAVGSGSSGSGSSLNANDTTAGGVDKVVFSFSSGVSNMSFDQFVSCLDMLFEQNLALLRSAVGVNKFLREEGIVLKDDDEHRPRIPDGVCRGGVSGGGVAVGTILSSDVAAGEGGEINDSSSSSKTTAAGMASSNAAALSLASELAHKSISELLRLRKDAHSLVGFEEMKRLWDTCLAFTLQLEKFSGSKAYGLRSTLLAQAKAFVERKHESHMASLVAALDCEKWQQCDVSAERQAALTRLCLGRAVLSTKSSSPGAVRSAGVEVVDDGGGDKLSGDRAADDPAGRGASGRVGGAAGGGPSSSGRREPAEALVEGSKYKVVWSCLLLVEMTMADVSCAAHFQTLATNVVGKICDLLRLFNARTTQLVLGAGAIHSAARLKSINAKHLALVTQCLGLVTAILPHVRAALMAQLPSKQHLLLVDLDRIKKDYGDHTEKVLTKFVSIIGGIIEHGLAPRIHKIDFDSRASNFPAPKPQPPPDGGGVGSSKDNDSHNAVVDLTTVSCCQFLEGVATNTRKMHQVLSSLLPHDHLRDVFSRIFLYVDQKVPSLFIAAAATEQQQQQGSTFSMPKTEKGKRRMILEVKSMSENLNQLAGVTPLKFTAAAALERELGMAVEMIMAASGRLKSNDNDEVSAQVAAADASDESLAAQASGKGGTHTEAGSLTTIGGDNGSAASSATNGNVNDERAGKSHVVNAAAATLSKGDADVDTAFNERESDDGDNNASSVEDAIGETSGEKIMRTTKPMDQGKEEEGKNNTKTNAEECGPLAKAEETPIGEGSTIAGTEATPTPQTEDMAEI